MIKSLSLFAVASAFLMIGNAEAAPHMSRQNLLQAQKDILRIISPKRVFITGESFTGNLGGLSGADAICQSAAESADLSGSFMAWLSDSQESPGTRFLTYSVGPYLDVRGRPIAADYGDLVDGTLGSFLLSDEFGNDTSSVEEVWTGTRQSGIIVSPDAPDSCADWTSSSADPAFRGLVGVNNATDDSWSALDFRTCNSLKRLYCFQQ